MREGATPPPVFSGQSVNPTHGPARPEGPVPLPEGSGTKPGGGVSGIILAGGDSRRMGRDKAFLPWGDTTLIEHLLERLRPVTDELIVAVKDARAFRRLKATIVEDCVPDAHALGGLYTGLRAASHELCFVCGCDSPFVNAPLIRFLVEQADGYELVIPKTRQRFEPLHALYAKPVLRAIEEQLRSRQWDLTALALKVYAKFIEPDVIHRFDPEELSFFNINAPEDLAQALLIQQRREASAAAL